MTEPRKRIMVFGARPLHELSGLGDWKSIERVRFRTSEGETTASCLLLYYDHASNHPIDEVIHDGTRFGEYDTNLKPRPVDTESLVMHNESSIVSVWLCEEYPR
jgi:hypothetical protein